MQNNLFEPDTTTTAALPSSPTPEPALFTRAPNAGRGVIADQVPAGYARVKDGPLRDDDLVWDCVGKRFLRNDSADWTDGKPADADGLVYVVRSIRSAQADGDRKYTIRR